jgi:hypothetical protein
LVRYEPKPCRRNLPETAGDRPGERWSSRISARFILLRQPTSVCIPRPNREHGHLLQTARDDHQQQASAGRRLGRHRRPHATLVTHASWDSPRISSRGSAQYRENIWEGQNYRPEVWVEKAALPVIEPICGE